MPELTVDQALKIIEHDRSVDDLRRYFDTSNTDSSTSFTGAWFERFDGGGDRPEIANDFTAADLLAVECLSVRVPIRVGISLLHGSLGTELNTLLEHVPLTDELGTGNAALHVGDNSPADQAWRILRHQNDVGWVTAGKLLARKRPHLIPVWDQVVRCVYRPPKQVNEWIWLDLLLREGNGRLRAELGRQRSAAGLDTDISILRTLDVILWMRHRREHRIGRCPGIAIDRS